jgi:hypothetical protein
LEFGTDIGLIWANNRLALSQKRVSVVFGLPSTSNAATDGCPDTWTIDTKQFPSRELRLAKEKLGPNMILSDADVEIIEYRGEEGISPKIENLRVSTESGSPPEWQSLLYLYGKSTIKYTQKVEVKDCKSPGLFTFVQNVPTGGIGGNFRNSPLTVRKMSGKKWAEENIQAFVDFKAQSKFEEYLEKITSEKIISATKIKPYRNNENFVIPHLLFQFYTVPGSGLKYGVVEGPIPQLLTPECLMYVLDENGKQFNPVIKVNKTCRFSWSMHSFKPEGAGEMVHEMVIFDKVIAITYTKSSVSITCTKGKTTKKVSGTNPKCPKGYEKAS